MLSFASNVTDPVCLAYVPPPRISMLEWWTEVDTALAQVGKGPAGFADIHPLYNARNRMTAASAALMIALDRTEAEPDEEGC